MHGRNPFDELPQVSHSARIIGWIVVLAIVFLLAYLTLAGGSAKAAAADPTTPPPMPTAEQELAALRAEFAAKCPNGCVMMKAEDWQKVLDVIHRCHRGDRSI